MDEAIKIIWTEMNNHGDSERALAALREEGYDLYRPGECTYIEVEDIGNDDDLLDVMVTGAAPAGEYRLVPVGGEG